MSKEQTYPNGTVVLPIVQEELHVSKRVIDTGRGVRVHRHVSEQAARVDEMLWEERVHVERVASDSLLTELPQPRQEGDTLIVPVVEEVLVVEKRYRVKEELRITREREAHRYTATMPLRREEVDIERFDDATARRQNVSPDQT
jgi:stress response protein YsnF